VANNINVLVPGVHFWTDHAPTDADFEVVPTDGAIAIDVENQHLWVRCRGAWVQFV